MKDLESGQKDPDRVAGAPFPPEPSYDDGQRDRVRRSVPTAPAKPTNHPDEANQSPTRVTTREEHDDDGA